MKPYNYLNEVCMYCGHRFIVAQRTDSPLDELMFAVRKNDFIMHRHNCWMRWYFKQMEKDNEQYQNRDNLQR